VAITYACYADWNADGDWGDANEDISAYVMACQITRGRDRDMDDFNASTCTLTLRNDSKRFTPNYATSPLYPNVRTGIKVQVTATSNGVTYNLFTGFIDRPSCDYDTRTATLYCADEMKRLGKKKIKTALEQDVASDVLIDDTLYNPGGAAFTGGAASWDKGPDRYAYAGWYDKYALSCIREVEQSEGSRAWIDGSGDIHWEDRHHRLKAPHNASLATYTGIMQEGPYDLRVDDVINEADATASPMVPAEASELFTLAHKITLAPGAYEDISIDYGGIALEASEPLASEGDLVANTSPNDSGTDCSNDIDVDFTGYAAGADVRLTNNGSVHAYVTVFTVWGKKLDSDSIAKHTEDATSQAQYGERTGSVGGALLSNPNVAQAMADWLVATKKDPLDGIEIRFTASKNATNMLAACVREISDRITIVEPVYAINGDFFLEGIDHEITKSGRVHQVTWRLSECPAAESLFIVGTTRLDAGALMAY
jgi:hypothetical protein